MPQDEMENRVRMEDYYLVFTIQIIPNKIGKQLSLRANYS